MTRDKAGTWSPWALVALACSVALSSRDDARGRLRLGQRDVKLHARRGLRVALVAIVLGLIVTP